MVTVIGLGFVGVTTALGFSELGNTVYGFDRDPRRIQNLCEKKIDFVEPHLTEMLELHLNKRFFINEDISSAVSKSTCLFICVGSPCLPDGSADLSQVEVAVESCLGNIPKDGVHRTIVIKSTVPPGTCDSIIEPLIRKHGYTDDEVSAASNPEFLREGFCWDDFINPSRVVIGTSNTASLQDIQSLYSPLTAPVHSVSSCCAEFSKYLSNMMLASMISFSNELAYAAKVFGNIDIVSAFKTLHDDIRLTTGSISSYLYPGCGYGGYCLPKDIKAFSSALGAHGYNSDFLDAVISINDRVVDQICDEAMMTIGQAETVGILGLAFKPGTNDVRESASARIIAGLLARGYTSIMAYDPMAIDSFRKNYPTLEVEFAETSQKLLEQSTAVIIATAWDEFKQLDYSDKKLIDGRYIIQGEVYHGKEV